MIAVIGVTALATGALAACGGSSDAVPTPGASIGTSTDQAIPKQILGLPFVDSAAKTVHLSDFRGKTIVLSDVMTLCQETCPLDTATVVQTARDENKAGKKNDIVYLSITVDPLRDTRPQIAAYRNLYAPVPSNWQMLTGSPAATNMLWTFLGVWRKKVSDDASAPKNWRTGTPLTYDIEHSDEVFLIDPEQHERFLLEGPPVAPKGDIPASLYTFMSGPGHQNVVHPASTAWTEKQALTALRWVTSL